MSRAIKAIIEKVAPVKRVATPAHAKRLTANWQNGFESGSYLQRKLRLAFTNVAAQSAA
jgi:hypothetical protein